MKYPFCALFVLLASASACGQPEVGAPTGESRLAASACTDDAQCTGGMICSSGECIYAVGLVRYPSLGEAWAEGPAYLRKGAVGEYLLSFAPAPTTYLATLTIPIPQGALFAGPMLAYTSHFCRLPAIDSAEAIVCDYPAIANNTLGRIGFKLKAVGTQGQRIDLSSNPPRFENLGIEPSSVVYRPPGGTEIRNDYLDLAVRVDIDWHDRSNGAAVTRPAPDYRPSLTLTLTNQGTLTAEEVAWEMRDRSVPLIATAGSAVTRIDFTCKTFGQATWATAPTLANNTLSQSLGTVKRLAPGASVQCIGVVNQRCLGTSTLEKALFCNSSIPTPSSLEVEARVVGVKDWAASGAPSGYPSDSARIYGFTHDTQALGGTQKITSMGNWLRLHQWTVDGDTWFRSGNLHAGVAAMWTREGFIDTPTRSYGMWIPYLNYERHYQPAPGFEITGICSENTQSGLYCSSKRCPEGYHRNGVQGPIGSSWEMVCAPDTLDPAGSKQTGYCWNPSLYVGPGLDCKAICAPSGWYSSDDDPYYDNGLGQCIASGGACATGHGATAPSCSKSCVAGYNDDGRALGVCVAAGTCALGRTFAGGACPSACDPGYHKDGTENCIKDVAGYCAAGHYTGLSPESCASACVQPGYVDDGTGNGTCTVSTNCPLGRSFVGGRCSSICDLPGYYDDGRGTCIASGASCAAGHGTTAPSCTSACQTGYHDDGSGTATCVANTLTRYCPIGRFDPGTGACTSSCQSGFHDNGQGKGVCIANGDPTCAGAGAATRIYDPVRESCDCPSGYHEDGLGNCVNTTARYCPLGRYVAATGECAATCIQPGYHDDGQGIGNCKADSDLTAPCAALRTYEPIARSCLCQTGYHEKGDGTCAADSAGRHCPNGRYIAATGDCAADCIQAGFHDDGQNKGICIADDSSTPCQLVSAGLYRDYDPVTKSCSCPAGYHDNGLGACIAGGIRYCPVGQFDAATGLCSPACIQPGYHDTRAPVATARVCAQGTACAGNRLYDEDMNDCLCPNLTHDDGTGGGDCIDNAASKLCADGHTYVAGACTTSCTDPLYHDDGRGRGICVLNTAATKCFSGYTWNGTTLSCPCTGHDKQDGLGTCATGTTCGSYSTFNAGLNQCLCNAGYHDNGQGACIADAATYCATGHYDGEGCSRACQPLFHDNGAGTNTCVADNAALPCQLISTGLYRDYDPLARSCTCPAGYHEKGDGICGLDSAGACGSYRVYEPVSRTCPCAAGYYETGRGGTCLNNTAPTYCAIGHFNGTSCDRSCTQPRFHDSGAGTNTCIADNAAAPCPAGRTYDPVARTCACAPGYHENGAGTCVNTATCATGRSYNATLDLCSAECIVTYHDNGRGTCITDTSGNYCALGHFNGESCDRTCSQPKFHDNGAGANTCLADNAALPCQLISTGLYRDYDPLLRSCTCPSGYHEKGDGTCGLDSGSVCATGRAYEPATRSCPCSATYHDDGRGGCVSNTANYCALGHYVGSDLCSGACAQVGFHDDGSGMERCLGDASAVKCAASSIWDASALRCVTGCSAAGYHDDGTGNCVKDGTVNYCNGHAYDGATGTCVGALCVQSGFHDDGTGKCVADDATTGYCGGGLYPSPTSGKCSPFHPDPSTYNHANNGIYPFQTNLQVEALGGERPPPGQTLAVYQTELQSLGHLDTLYANRAMEYVDIYQNCPRCAAVTLSADWTDARGALHHDVTPIENRNEAKAAEAWVPARVEHRLTIEPLLYSEAGTLMMLPVSAFFGDSVNMWPAKLDFHNLVPSELPIRPYLGGTHWSTATLSAPKRSAAAPTQGGALDLELPDAIYLLFQRVDTVQIICDDGDCECSGSNGGKIPGIQTTPFKCGCTKKEFDEGSCNGGVLWFNDSTVTFTKRSPAAVPQFNLNATSFWRRNVSQNSDDYSMLDAANAPNRVPQLRFEAPTSKLHLNQLRYANDGWGAFLPPYRPPSIALMGVAGSPDVPIADGADVEIPWLDGVTELTLAITSDGCYQPGALQVNGRRYRPVQDPSDPSLWTVVIPAPAQGETLEGTVEQFYRIPFSVTCGPGGRCDFPVDRYELDAAPETFRIVQYEHGDLLFHPDAWHHVGHLEINGVPVSTAQDGHRLYAWDYAYLWTDDLDGYATCPAGKSIPIVVTFEENAPLAVTVLSAAPEFQFSSGSAPGAQDYQVLSSSGTRYSTAPLGASHYIECSANAQQKLVAVVVNGISVAGETLVDYQNCALFFPPALQVAGVENLVEFVFAEEAFTVTAENAAGHEFFGLVAPSAKNYSRGSIASFKIYPAPGYEVDTVIRRTGGTSVDARSDCTIDGGTQIALCAHAVNEALAYIVAFKERVSGEVAVVAAPRTGQELFGLVTPGQKRYASNSSITFLIVPAPGYELESVTRTAGGVTSDAFGECAIDAVTHAATCTRGGVTEDLRYEVTFKAIRSTDVLVTVAVRPGQELHGIAAPASRSYASGSTIHFSVMPASGFEVDEVAVSVASTPPTDALGDCAIDAKTHVALCERPGVVEALAFEVSFKPITHKLYVEANIEGLECTRSSAADSVITAAVAPAFLVEHGEDESVTCGLPPGQQLVGAFVNGIAAWSDGALGTIRAVGITRNSAVKFVYAPLPASPFHINAVASSGQELLGTISPAQQVVADGATGSIDILPAHGYVVDSVTTPAGEVTCTPPLGGNGPTRCVTPPVASQEMLVTVVFKAATYRLFIDSNVAGLTCTRSSASDSVVTSSPGQPSFPVTFGTNELVTCGLPSGKLLSSAFIDGLAAWYDATAGSVMVAKIDGDTTVTLIYSNGSPGGELLVTSLTPAHGTLGCTLSTESVEPYSPLLAPERSKVLCVAVAEPGYTVVSLIDSTFSAAEVVTALEKTGPRSWSYSIEQLLVDHVLRVLFKKELGAACGGAEECASTFCVDGLCCDSRCDGQCEQCSGNGACLPTPAGEAPLSPRAACVDQGSCAGACNGLDRVACHYPRDERCSPARCAECVGGNCVDGLCCDAPCADSCAACDLSGSEGLCMPLPAGAAPHGARAPCRGDGSLCSGACDGTRSVCAYPPATLTCTEARCEGEFLVGEALCDGAGACGTPSMTTCSPFRCERTRDGEARCAKACDSSDDCAEGHLCLGHRCVPPSALGGAQGTAGCSATSQAPSSLALLLLATLLWLFRRQRAAPTLLPLFVFIAGVASFGPRAALAQRYEQAFVLQRFQPPLQSHDVLGTSSALTPGALELSVGAYLNYASEPLRLKSASSNEVIIRDQTALDLGVSLGLGERFELSAVLPMTLDLRGGDLGGLIPPATGDFHSASIAGLRLTPKLRLASAGPFHLAAAMPLYLPLGTTPYLSGSSSLNPMLLGEYVGEDFRLLANVGFLGRGAAEFLDVAIGPAVTFGLGGELPFTARGERFALQATLAGEKGLTHGGMKELPLELLGALKWQAADGLAVTIGGGPGLTTGYGSPRFRFLAGVLYSLGSLSAKEAAPRESCPVCESPTDVEAPPAPRPPPKEETPCPPAELSGDQIVLLEPVFFATDQDVILFSSYRVLSAVADILKKHPEVRQVRIEGHTDNVAPAKYNLDLSKRRAANVRSFLIQEGIEPARLVSEGYGLERPIDTNETEAGRANNRRVMFVITKREGGQ